MAEPTGRRRGTLRRRLTIGVLVLVVTVLVGVGAATLLTLRTFLIDQLDTQLVQTTSQVADRRLSDISGLPEGTLLIEFDDSGQVTQAPVLVVGRGRDDGRASLSSSDVAELKAVGASPSPVDLSDLGGYRAVASQDPSGHQVVVAQPTNAVQETLGRLLAIEVTALVVASVVVAVVGYAFIRRELAPLERVATTARRVRELPLSTSGVDERVATDGAPAEVADVAVAFNEMLDHVDASLEARAVTEGRLRQFIADASHELRTPLVSIRGYAELYRRSDADAAQRATAMARIESEAKRMGVLVDDLLLLARLDQGRPLRREPVDLTRLAAESSSDVRVTAPRHRLVLELPPEPVYVVGDEDRLRQVLVNLLANATRHTPEGTPVTVRVAAVGDQGVLGVVDEGPGIPESLQPRVFERFTRAEESRTRATGGTGLGLSIVAAVVGALDGDVGIDSRPGHTAVTVRLPLAAAPD
jgi:two-component system, OmpR family, sensor kinase